MTHALQEAPSAQTTRDELIRERAVPGLMNNRYISVATLRAQKKGRIIKALWWKGWRFSWVLIKEGLHDIWKDSAGRDIRDRLKWQYDVQNVLFGALPVPRPVDLFSQNDMTCFVMEFIKGRTLSQQLDMHFGSLSWADLELSKKTLILNYLQQLISITKKMHKAGYCHRDLTPLNFLVNRDGQLIMIDLELAYDFCKGTPNPPYELGTDGYTSPEQYNHESPSVYDDIFSIGAVMIQALTHLNPLKFRPNGHDTLKRQLHFFVGDWSFADIVTRCFHAAPDRRPPLSDLQEGLQKYQDMLTTGKGHDETDKGCVMEDGVIKGCINKALRWLFAVYETAYNEISSGKSQECELIRRRDDLLGIAFMVGILKKASLLQREFSLTDDAHLDVFRQIIAGDNHQPQGLHSCLVPVIFSECISERVIVNNCISDSLDTFLKRSNTFTGQTSAIAGQGLALLYAQKHLSKMQFTDRLKAIVHRLLGSQHRNGSWSWPETSKTNAFTGLDKGTSGILIFLLSSYRFLPTPEIKQAVDRGLAWLCRSRIKEERGWAWPVHTNTKKINPWLGEGYCGVALAFLKAYEVFKTPAYKTIAEKTLNNHPPRLVCSDFSHYEGLAGLGEVYVEAFRVLGNETWRKRASWIAGLLVHACSHGNDGTCWWVTDDDEPVSAGFLKGNSGVVHFLFRYLMPERIGFPFLSPAADLYHETI